MNKKEDLVKHFFPYCSQCNGLCCKRGVVTVFQWEMKKLSRYENMCVDRISDQRGTCKDIAIDDLCIFYKNNGCRLPEKLRPTDCLTYPFYPKLKDNNGELEIDHFVIDRECPFHKELAENKVILEEVKSIWKRVGKKVTNQEVGDWLGKDGNWEDWYKNTMDIKDE